MEHKSSVVIISLYANDTVQAVDEMFQSLFNQSLKEFDIFVQEDGLLSNELESYLDTLMQNKKITSLSKRQVNRGFAYSLNELIKRVLALKYDYIFRMDADDICVPTRIEQQLSFLTNHPEVDLVGGWIEEFNTDSGEKRIVQYPQTHAEIFEMLARRSPMAHVSVAFRANFFERFGFYDASSKCEDLALWVHALSLGAVFHNLQEVLVRVRTNNAFFSRRKNHQRAFELWRIKVNATQQFKFGFKGYLYATAHYLVWMAPDSLKQFIYKHFR